jgi:hypothetical protein
VPCLTCGATTTTRSHLYGKTLRKEFPGEHRTVNSLLTVDKTPAALLTRAEDGRGVPFSQGRWLCAQCNGVWMNQLEDSALPTVAAIVRGERILLAQLAQRTIASWAVAVTVLRSEADRGIRSFPPVLAHTLRSDGIEAITVGVWLAATDRERVIRPHNTLASTYWSATDDRSGAIAIYWLKSMAVVVAVADHLAVAAPGMKMIARAAPTIWPTTGHLAWPPKSTVPDRTLLRSTGLPLEKVSHAAFQHPVGFRGREERDIIRVPATADEQIVARLLADAWTKRGFDPTG